MSNYKNQVALLLQVLPEVAKEKSFALHGGTAINLFVRDMPRLSVDIDLTYIPVEDRVTSFKCIIEGIKSIKTNLGKILPEAVITITERNLKLQITTDKAQIKLEVSQINRGIIADTTKLLLCDKAQEDFNSFCSISVVSLGQLYGGKICAALDRQHPRDLFDVKYLLENDGFTDEIRRGFIFLLLSSKRPLNEILHPNLIDQRETMTNHFDGMTTETFTYEDFENTRTELIQTIHQHLTAKDREFLINFSNLTPDWNIYNFEDFPAVQWKLQNLVSLKSNNLDKFNKQHQEVKDLLDK